MYSVESTEMTVREPDCELINHRRGTHSRRMLSGRIEGLVFALIASGNVHIVRRLRCKLDGPGGGWTAVEARSDYRVPKV